MKRAILIVAALVMVSMSGCTTVQVNPLYHELAYQLTPALNVERFVDKSIAVVPFDDGRMYDKANISESTSVLWNLLPLVIYTTAWDSHPEVTNNVAVRGLGNKVVAAGTLADAGAKLLADYLHRSRRFSKAVYVEAAEVKGAHTYDYVLRGTLVESKLRTTRISYGVGPAAVALYLLGAPMKRYSASLTVDWQLYDSTGVARGPKRTATLEAPIVMYAGLYYGNMANQKKTPLGLYIEAVSSVNARIAEDVSEQVQPTE